MKPNLSDDSILTNNQVKKHKSSTDVQKIALRKKSLNNKKSNIEIKENIYNNKENSFICSHKSNFISFCEICSLDLCFYCEKNHLNHKIIKFEEIIPKREEINKIKITIKKYIDDYNKLIEEIYKWKKELDKNIFYFEEQIKNDSTINKSLEFLENFDFSQNNNFSSISKYIKISNLLTKDNNDNINNDNILGGYEYKTYINSKKILDRIINYGKEDFINKSIDIIKLVFSFLTKKIYKYENKPTEKINLNSNNHCTNENDNFFNMDNIYNNTYTFSNAGKKENNINEININYFNNTINDNNNINKFNENNELIKNIPIQKIENQSKSIGNIFLEEEEKKAHLPEKNENNNSMNYMKFKKSIIKSSTLRRLNAINKNDNEKIYIKNKNKNESNSVNYINNKNKKDITHIYSTNNNKEIYKYIPKIKKQNRVYTVNNNSINNNINMNLNNNLNTINSYNNTNESNKKSVYKHKKLNSVSITNYINQSLPIDYNNYYYNSEYDNLATLNNSTGNYTNLIRPINLDQIKNTYNPNIDRKNLVSFNSFMSPIISLNTLESNKTPSSYFSIRDTNGYLLSNKRNDIKKKLLTKNLLTHNNYNTILETPITFSSKLTSESNTLMRNKTNLNTNYKDYTTEPRTSNNNKYLIDPNKNLYIGLELGNSECSIGIVDQNKNNFNNIELFDFDTDSKNNQYSIPTIVSFDSKSNEIKIGVEAENNILNNPSQTIFNILKIIGKSYKQIYNDIDIWPFKIYYNEDLCRPYVKINYNKQKNRIFFFEDLLSIYLKKIFEIFFAKIKLINNDMNNNIDIINLILVVTLPNNYNYLQRKIIEKIFQTQIFPQNKDITNRSINNNINDNINMNGIKNNKDINLYSGYKILLKDIKIENGSSLAGLCLFNSKLKLKNNINEIFILNSKLYDNNKEFLMNNANTNNNANKERNSVNSVNSKQKTNKNILVINIDGGFTNISLGTISHNMPKEKNGSKIKNSKNLKKNNLNILEIKELSGNELGEEDLVDIYINYCLKKFDDNIYKECLKSSRELARLRQSVLIAKKYFNSTEKEINISISLPHKSLDLKINLNQKDYEKSCQEIFGKIISLIKNILKKAKLSENNIDIIMLIASKLTADKIYPVLRNIFPSNTKIIQSNSNTDKYITIGATMQALNNNMIKPLYKFIDITNMNFGIETLNGVMDVVVPKGLKIPVQKIKYVKIKNNENNEGENLNHLNKYLEINIYEGDNKFVKNNRLISCANIDKRNFKEEKTGEGFTELLVEFEINNYSNLSVFVLDVKNFKRRFECLTNLDMVKG